MLTVILATLIVVANCLNLRPIIGILTNPSNDTDPTNSTIMGSYVQWLNQGGARVAVIPFDTPKENLLKLLNSVNGVHFQGGSLNLLTSTKYYQTAKFIFDWAVASNQRGVYFPLWGTCQGFQLFSIIVSRDETILLRNYYDSWNLPLPLQLTREASQSRIFRHLTPELKSTLTTKNSTMNLHHDGVTPTSFAQNQKLSNFFNLLSVNQDRRGKLFGSTIESKTLPIYATQWHPERNQFEWGPRELLDHSLEGIQLMQYFANFFIQESRKNNNRFESYEEELKHLIYNYCPTPIEWDDADGTPDELVYYIPLQRNKNYKN